jgi:hypothetical protein
MAYKEEVVNKIITLLNIGKVRFLLGKHNKNKEL